MSLATAAPIIAGLAAAGLGGARNDAKYRGAADAEWNNLKKEYFAGWKSGDPTKMFEAKNKLDVIKARSSQMGSRDTAMLGLGAAGTTAALIAAANRGRSPYSLGKIAPIAAGLAAYGLSGVPLAEQRATQNNINEMRRIRDERAGRTKFQRRIFKTLPSDSEMRTSKKNQEFNSENLNHLVNRDRIGVGLAAAGLTAGGIALAKKLRRNKDEKQRRLREGTEGHHNGPPGTQPRFARQGRWR